jgi:hypothetical protein
MMVRDDDDDVDGYTLMRMRRITMRIMRRKRRKRRKSRRRVHVFISTTLRRLPYLQQVKSCGHDD